MKQVIGEFEIELILHDEVEELWNVTKEYSGISEDFFFSYFDERVKGYAIKIRNYVRYSVPKSLKSVYGMTPPQSFAYVD